MTERLLQEFLNQHDYDIRKSGDGRWIDQKCAFDTVSFVADCIVDYLENGGTQPFESPQIWHRDYSKTNVMRLFGKPDPTTKTTKDEYNKFFRQPMKMLVAAGVLSEEKILINNGPLCVIKFSVVNYDVLEYIAMRDRNALEFMGLYIEKTLKDSGLWDPFASFFDEQTDEWYDTVKAKFTEFCIRYTPINTNVEAYRIFIKVLNQLAFKYKKKGTIRGAMSKNVITLSDIIYNKTNWYDNWSGKDKNVSRGDFGKKEVNADKYDYEVTKAKKYLRSFLDRYYQGEPEVRDRYSINNKVSAMHHIFPAHAYPTIAAYYENLIGLSTAQHMQEAHPNGNTREVDHDFQYTCLIAKTDNIRRNLSGMDDAPVIYDFNDFMFVLNTGLNTDYFSRVTENDFGAVVQGIDLNM